MQYAQVLPARERKTNNAYITHGDPQVLINSYLRYIERNEGLAPNTVGSRRSLLQGYLGHLKHRSVHDICDLTQNDVDEFIELRALSLKPSSLGQLKTTLRGFFYYCEFRRKIDVQVDYSMIKRKREKPPKVRVYSEKQIKTVIHACDNHQDKLMLALLWETGIRIGELVKVSVEDINDKEIHIRGKGSYDRVVYITDGLSKALRQHVIDNIYRSGEVFRHQMAFTYLPDDTYQVDTVRKRLRRQFERAGIYKMHPHEIRHSFSIYWLHNRGDLRTLQRILGHSSLEVTQRYLQITDHFTESAYSRVHKTSVLS